MVTVGRDGTSLEALTLPRRDMVPRCCENGRPVVTDPHTGQTICSCQYGSGLLGYPRVPTLGDAVYGASAAYAAAAQSYVPLGADGSAFYSPLTSPPFDGTKEAVEGWRHLAHTGGVYFPYDTSMAAYPYGPGFGPMDLNAARRKNATKEATNTLKAWLYEHRKNPYPTKGEKIMLAIITKMTLTQVSTWFANARRRLKKENKMTWSPRNRSDDDGDDFDDLGDDDKDDDDNKSKLGGSEAQDLSGRRTPHTANDEETATGSQDVADSSDGHIEVDDLPASPSPADRSRKDSIINTDSDVPQECDSPVLSISKDNGVTSPLPAPFGEIRSSGLTLERISSSSKKLENGEVGEGSPRPKIWSVSQFLPTNSDNHRSRESTVTSSLTSSTSHPYRMSSPSCPRVMSSPSQGHPFLPSVTSHGNFGGALSYVTHPLPMTINSTGLGFPYSLSSVKSNLSAPSTTVSRQEALLAANTSPIRSQLPALSHKSRDISSTRPTEDNNKRESPSDV